ncbi:MAG: thiolase family protein [Acidimicrobiales bacterium]
MTTESLREKYVIAGIGHTKYGDLGGRSTLSMNVEACRGALVDANVEKYAVDALFVKYPTSNFQSMYGQKVAERLGLHPRVGGVWDQAGASPSSMIAFAAMAIDAGQCEVALVTFADNPRSVSRHAYAHALGPYGPYGWFGVVAGYAMIARAHMEQFGTTGEHLGAVAVACREHGSRNPNAQLQRSISLEDHEESPWVVEPLRRSDCCLISDGGAAVVVMSAARADELGVSDAVPILGFGQGQTSWEVAQRPSLVATEARRSAETAFAMAGITPAQIDAAQLYDCFTIAVLMTIEAYGFCAPGQAGPFVSEPGALQVGGSLPLNTSGGLLSETGMPGLQLILEGVRQIRGTSTSQVPAAKTCVVSNQGGIMQTHSTLILGRC